MSSVCTLCECACCEHLFGVCGCVSGRDGPFKRERECERSPNGHAHAGGDSPTHRNRSGRRRLLGATAMGGDGLSMIGVHMLSCELSSVITVITLYVNLLCVTYGRIITRNRSKPGPPLLAGLGGPDPYALPWVCQRDRRLASSRHCTLVVVNWPTRDRTG